MKILTVSGSASRSSANTGMLIALANLSEEHTFMQAELLTSLPVYSPELDVAPWPPVVLTWRLQVRAADAVIISTPAYLHNMPAVLKNALEWLTTSGELDGKRTLALTYTPHPPRGVEAMTSLLWSLKALNANIVAQCRLYQNELQLNSLTQLEGEESVTLLKECIQLL